MTDCQVCADLQRQLDAVTRERDEAALHRGDKAAAVYAVIQTIGGTVEGHPTAPIALEGARAEAGRQGPRRKPSVGRCARSA
jgi:hypothetical protein